jgi:hypothetical protein
MVHDEEQVLAEGEQVVHRRDARDAGEPGERLVLAGQAADRVVPVGVETGVRARLLEHDLLAGPGVAARVDAAAVGEVQHPLDRVRQVGDGHRVAGREVRFEERGQRHPRRDVEHGVAAVGDEVAVGVGDGLDHHTRAVHCVPVGEGAVPHVEGAAAPAQVGEDVGAGFAVELRAELGEDPLARRVVLGVDRDEFSGVAAGRVLRDPGEQRGGRPQELERDAPLDAVVPHRVEDAVGVVLGRRGVDLPALQGDRLPHRWVDDKPVVLLAQRPPLGQGPCGGRERRSGGRLGVHRVVERRIRHAERLVVLVHPGSLRSSVVQPRAIVPLGVGPD